MSSEEIQNKTRITVGKAELTNGADKPGAPSLIETSDLPVVMDTVVTGGVAAADQAKPHSSAAISKELIGSIIAGRYRIIKLLGVGGMGLVFEAEHIMLGSKVAVKILNGDLATNDIALKRFAQEAKAASTLKHPNIAAVSDYGLTEGGSPYFVMDLVDGISLAEMVKEKGSLPWQEAVDFGIQISDAMAFAHFQGIVHRDLKPANIIVSKNAKGEEHATVVDFGIAKFANETQDAQKLTQTGEVFGSPLYMSPEQCTGKPMDNRSDVYSFGCLMYEVLTGTVPFLGSNAMATLYKQMNEAPASLRAKQHQQTTGAIPAGLDTVVLHCLEKNPDERYSSMDAVKADLQLVKRGLPPTRKSVKRLNLKLKSPNLVQTGLVTAVGTIVMFLGMAFWINKWQYEVVPWQRDYSAAKHAIERREYNQAVLSAEHGIKIGTAKHAPEHELAGLYDVLGDGLISPAKPDAKALDEARKAYEKAIVLSVDRSDKSKMQAYLKLGDMDDSLGRKKEALINYDSALSVFSDRYVDDAQRARLLIRKASVHENLGEFDKAKSELQDAVNIYKSVDKINTPAFIEALDKFSNFLKARGDASMSKKFADEARALRDSF